MTLTPLMQQYWELKKEAGGALLLFRMGDFYELFGEDAVEASQILEITLTSRDRNKENPTPMAGVPHHSVQGYIQKLLRAGKKVAIGEQMEDPGSTKTLVRREIVRILTPAVQFESEGSETAYLATAVLVEKNWVLACLDPSTGETRVSPPLTEEAFYSELSSLPIRHFLKFSDGELPLPVGALIENIPSNYLTPLQAEAVLKKNYQIENLSGFFSDEAAIHAVGILVYYVLKTQQKERLTHLRLPKAFQESGFMILGPKSCFHLDLLPTSQNTPNLFQFINKTRSSAGARKLKEWLLNPLLSSEEIRKRQDAVQELSKNPVLIAKVSQLFSQMYDFERISARVNTGLANPRDTYALGKSLALIPKISREFSALKSPLTVSLAAELNQASQTLEPLCREILNTQKEEPPFSIKEGGIFRRGTLDELDHLLSLTENGQNWLIELERSERENTGIGSLKVKYNRVFGYYIEITVAHLKNVPPHYQRKQTMVGAERFFTEELKKFEEEILTASARQNALEEALFRELLKKTETYIPALMEAAQNLACHEALVSLAMLSQEPGWIFPTVDQSLDLEITRGRHPMVDALMQGAFVPNSISLSPTTKLGLIITGPNMGGKSTLMRQVALIIILGQMGAPVPAQSAKWGVVHSIYTRIGAQDAISRGQSTFMVEVSELAHILHHANERSLIILDEIGRGTSTYDGVSVAWASLEWISREIKARTLFATHYHELTELEKELPLLANAHMAVEGTHTSQGDSIRFLYLLKNGPTNESFGIHVAKMAGLPGPVIDRAWKVLEALEKDKTSGMGLRIKKKQTLEFDNSDQLSLF